MEQKTISPQNSEKKSIWEVVLWSLALTPGIGVGGLIVITVIGALDDAITKLQSKGQWWVILVVAFILSLIYVVYTNRRKSSDLY